MALGIIVIFIVMSIITIISSKLSGISILDLVILASVLAPLAVLQTNLHKQRTDFINQGSIVFNKYSRLFQLCSSIFGIALFFGLHYYGQTNGFSTTVIYFLIAVVIQSAYYALIKFTIHYEIFLIPLGLIGLILFYSFVI